MNRPRAAIGSAAFFVVAPGIVMVLVPWLLTRWRVDDAQPWWVPVRVVGAVLVVAGAIVLVQAFVRFVVEGVGTPAPVAAPEHLVVGGMYRYVRNPMYVAGLAAIIGQAMLLGQLVLVLYAAVVGAASYAFVHFHEEPALRSRFGEPYERYLREVPGWWPRLPGR